MAKTFDEACKAIAAKIAGLVISKQHDYGPANILATGLYGIAVRQSDKAARLLNLTKTGKTPKNESVKDTLTDQAGYGIVGLMLLDGEFELPLADAIPPPPEFKERALIDVQPSAIGRDPDALWRNVSSTNLAGYYCPVGDCISILTLIDSPDGAYLTCPNDNMAYRYDLATGKRL